MSEPKMITAAVVVSVIAGILIIAGSLYTAFGDIGMIIGIVSGILVLLAGIMLEIRPSEGTMGLRVCCRWWGSMVLVFSVVSLLAYWLSPSIGILAGAVLGIVGAAVALLVKV